MYVSPSRRQKGRIHYEQQQQHQQQREVLHSLRSQVYRYGQGSDLPVLQGEGHGGSEEKCRPRGKAEIMDR